ncbi:MAG: AbrB/MazE/SpoVT family DNA-binding domain-containing protein [Steroidobacteraceae bacterium]
MTVVIVFSMAIAQSKVTAQGQISVPAEVRKKLGVGPGSVLEWDEQDDQVVVRRAARYTSLEIHDALFPQEAAEKGAVDVKAGIRKYMRKRHARR